MLLARQHRFLLAALQHLDAMYTATQAAHPPPVLVVGHSMGGVLACSAAQGLPGACLRHVSRVITSSVVVRTDAVGAVLALAAPLANSPWMGQARPHNGGIHPSSRSDARCYLIHIVVTGAHVHVAAEPQSDDRAGRLSQRWLPVRAHLRVYTTPPRCLIPMWCCSDIQVPDWMTAVSRVGMSLPQLVGVSADHQCIVWCHQGVAHMSQALRHLAASDGQTRAEAGVRYRDEALQTWFSPSKERSAARHHAATAAPVVVASLLALPALCLMRVVVCAAAGAPRGAEVLPSIALLGCSGLRSVVTCAPPGPLHHLGRRPRRCSCMGQQALAGRQQEAPAAGWHCGT